MDKSLKPDKFDGQDFKRWQNKMRFWLTTLKIFYVITDPEYVVNPDEYEPGRSACSKFQQDNDLCHGQILSALSNELYDLHYNTSSAKLLWEALEKKFGKEHVGEEKYVVGEYFDFKMVEDKSVRDQVVEIQNLVAKIVGKGIPIDERLQVPALIDKLPPSWSDFQVTLKHKREAMTLDDLIVAIQIEEKHREK